MGIRVIDLLDRKVFREKVRENLKLKNFLIKRYYKAEPFKLRDVSTRYGAYRDLLKRYAGDNVQFLHKSMEEGKSLLFEGAQGAFLDVDHGTYPFVTSSNTLAGNVACGAGVHAGRHRLRPGRLQGLYDARGGGPFPTELTGPEGELMREKGGEYGATTGRPRRCGWFDAVILRRAVIMNGVKAIGLMKLDVLDEFETINVCVKYRIGRKVYADPPLGIKDLSRLRAGVRAHGRMGDAGRGCGLFRRPSRQREEIRKAP